MRYDQVFEPLDAYLVAQSLEPPRPYKAFYPSDASCEVNNRVLGRCLRYQYWRWKQEPMTEPKTYRSWISAEFGKAYDDAFMRAYKACGVLFGEEIPFFKVVMGLPIAGRIDGLTKDKKILECKTAYGWKFAKELALDADINNYPQVILYMGLLGIDTCLFAYASRDNTGARMGHLITKQDIEKRGILLIKVLIRWKMLQVFIDTEVLPPRDFNILHDWQCVYCGYLNKCYSREELNHFFYDMKGKREK
jgi:hypothetical protein